MEVRFNLTQEDFLAFHSYLLGSRSKAGEYPQQATSEPRTRPIFWLIILLFVGFGLVAGMRPQINFKDPGIYVVMAVWGFIGLVWFWAWWSRNISPRKAFEAARRKNLVDDIVISITPEQFCYSNRTVALASSWTAIERIEHTNQYIFFMTGKSQAYVLPRRAFSTENEFWTFCETAKRYQQG